MEYVHETEGRGVGVDVGVGVAVIVGVGEAVGVGVSVGVGVGVGGESGLGDRFERGLRLRRRRRLARQPDRDGAGQQQRRDQHLRRQPARRGERGRREQFHRQHVRDAQLADRFGANLTRKPLHQPADRPARRLGSRIDLQRADGIRQAGPRLRDGGQDQPRGIPARREPRRQARHAAGLAAVAAQ